MWEKHIEINIKEEPYSLTGNEKHLTQAFEWEPNDLLRIATMIFSYAVYFEENRMLSFSIN